MLRLVLAATLLLIAAATGFFYGRHLHPVPDPSVATPEPASSPQSEEPPEAVEQTRGRTVEPADSGDPAAFDAEGTSPVAADPLPLMQRNLVAPLPGLKRDEILDTFDHSRGGGEHRHEAVDIMAPRGTPVMAIDDGTVRKLFTSERGGLTIYQFDPEEKYVYYYAHLDRYADGIREGDTVTRGDVIGYVGSTGNADPDAPHLHLAILELGPEKKWWEDTRAVNPYPILLGILSEK